MSMVERFLEQLRHRGLSVRRGEGDTLLLCGPGHEKTPEVLAACKAFKPDLLARLGGPAAPGAETPTPAAPAAVPPRVPL